MPKKKPTNPQPEVKSKKTSKLSAKATNPKKLEPKISSNAANKSPAVLHHVVYTKIKTMVFNIRAPRFSPEVKLAKSDPRYSGRLDRRHFTVDSDGLPAFYIIFKRAMMMIWDNAWLFTKLVIIHGVIYVLLVKSPESLTVQELRDNIKQSTGDNLFRQTYTITGYIFGSKTFGFRDPIVAFGVWSMASLTYIWSFREIIRRAKEASDKVNQSDAERLKTRILARDAYYNSMRPLASLFVIAMTVLFETIPFIAGFWLYSTAKSQAIITNEIENGFFIAIWVILSAFSVYSIIRSLVAVYFATLPDIYPLEAQQLSGEVIRFRRLGVFIKMLMLALTMIAFILVIFLIVLALLPQHLYLVVDILMVLGVLFYHATFFQLYLALAQNHNAPIEDQRPLKTRLRANFSKKLKWRKA